MATFEGYERREAKILSVLKEYGITYEDIKRTAERSSPTASTTSPTW